MRSSARRLGVLTLALVGCPLAAVQLGCGGEEERRPAASPRVELSGLYPAFDPGRSHYVARCGPTAEGLHAETGDGVTLAVGDGPRRRGSVPIDPGARPGEDFRIAVGDGPRRRAYRVRCLPADFPSWDFERLRDTPPGHFAVSFNAPGSRPWVVVFDHTGAPLWWYRPATRALWAQVLRDGTIAWARSFGDGYGRDPRMAVEVRSPAGRLLRLVRTRGSITDGHEFHQLGNGNVLTDTYVPERADLRRFGGPAAAAIVAAEIQEIAPDGEVVWRWSSRGRISLAETGRWWRNVLSNAKPGERDIATYDPFHINSIEPRGPNEVVVSMRHTDAVYGVERSTGEVRWKLGGSRTPESLRIVGDPARKLLGGQHDARIAPDGTLSVYDNSKDRPRRPRVVFYRLEPERDRARYLGQLNDPSVRRSHCCGSARQLPGGGWLVSWGDNPLVSAFNEAGRVAFRLRLAAPTFRAVPSPGGAIGAAGLDAGLERMEPDRVAGGAARRLRRPPRG